MVSPPQLRAKCLPWPSSPRTFSYFPGGGWTEGIVTALWVGLGMGSRAARQGGSGLLTATRELAPPTVPAARPTPLGLPQPSGDVGAGPLCTASPDLRHQALGRHRQPQPQAPRHPWAFLLSTAPRGPTSLTSAAEPSVSEGAPINSSSRVLLGCFPS